jgi:hypothetical protein
LSCKTRAFSCKFPRHVVRTAGPNPFRTLLEYLTLVTVLQSRDVACSCLSSLAALHIFSAFHEYAVRLLHIPPKLRHCPHIESTTFCSASLQIEMASAMFPASLQFTESCRTVYLQVNS